MENTFTLEEMKTMGYTRFYFHLRESQTSITVEIELFRSDSRISGNLGIELFNYKSGDQLLSSDKCKIEPYDVTAIKGRSKKLVDTRLVNFITSKLYELYNYYSNHINDAVNDNLNIEEKRANGIWVSWMGYPGGRTYMSKKRPVEGLYNLQNFVMDDDVYWMDSESDSE